jgi:small subunit ribosomal protein S19
MARSLKKGPFVHYKLDKKVQENIAMEIKEL